MTRNALFMIGLAAVAASGCGDKTVTTAEAPSVVANQKWYADELYGGVEYVDDFSIEAGHAHQINIETQSELLVGYRTEAGLKEYIDEPPEETLVMMQAETDLSFAGPAGGRTFSPVNGRIALVISNRLPETVRMVVFSKTTEFNKTGGR